jgi:uncharacterized protein YbjT (DUF2867 family)
VHCVGTSKGDEIKARHLVRAASRAGVQHLVYISVVCADRVPGSQSSAASIAPSSGTSRRSLLQKESWPIRGCPGRHCVRPSSMTASSRLSRRWPGCRWYSPPGWRFQPVDTSEVAAQLAQCALGAPAGLVPDLGGPKVYGIADWSAGTCARVASIGRSCQSTPQAALLVRSRMARTLPRTTLWVSGLGGLSRRARDRTARRRR